MNFRQKLAASLLSTAVLTSGVIPALPLNSAIYAADVQTSLSSQLAQKVRANYDLLLPEEKQLLQDARSFTLVQNTDWWRNTLGLDTFINAAKAKGVTKDEAVGFLQDLIAITSGFNPSGIDADIQNFRSKHAGTFHKLTNNEYTLDQLLSLTNDIEQNARQSISSKYAIRIGLFLTGSSTESLHTLVHDIAKSAIEQSLTKPEYQKFNGKLGELGLSIEQVLGFTVNMDKAAVTSGGKTLGDVRDTFAFAGARKYLHAELNNKQFKTTEQLSVTSGSDATLKFIANLPSNSSTVDTVNITQFVDWKVTADANGTIPSSVQPKVDEKNGTVTFRPQADSKFLVATSRAKVQGNPLTLAKFQLNVAVQGTPLEIPAILGQPTTIPVQAGASLTQPVNVRVTVPGAGDVIVQLPIGFKLPDGTTALTVKSSTEAPTNGLTKAGPILDFSFGQPGPHVPLSQPVTVILPVPSADTSKVGIFYYNEGKQKWEYQGSTPGAGNTVSASVSHFSIYGALSDTVAPAAPTITKSVADSSSVTLTVDASDPSGIKGYQVYQNESATPVSYTLVSENELKIAGLQSSTQYKFKVKAVDNLNNPSDFSSAVPVTTGSTGGGGGGGGGGGATPSTPTTPTTPTTPGTGTTPGNGGQTPVVTTPDFIDVDGHWAQKDIDFMAANGYVHGTGNGKFEPNRVITRAEFAAMLVNILAPTEEGKASFADVPANAWYADSVKRAYAAGIIHGVGKGRFAPGQVITREQMAAMIANALKYKGVQPSVQNVNAALKAFGDKGSISKWAVQAAAIAVEADILHGQKKGKAVTFAPKSKASRAEAIVMLKRFLEK